MMHSVVWMLFLVTVSAEIYNEIPRDEFYPELSDPAEPATDDEPSVDEYWRRNQFLFKLMKFLQRDPDAMDRYEDETPEQTWPDQTIVKAPEMKRWFSVFNSNAAKSRPQRKWKIKKGKGPMLCYLKLCSFRNYY